MKGQTVLPGDSSEISEENNEEDSVKELTWQPTIVIGIGGTGKEVVLNIKEQLERLPEVPPVLSFVVIDTAAAKSQELEPQEWHHITVDGSIVVRNLSMYPSIEKWWIKGLRAGRIDRGAGQKRIRGRLALFYPENFNEIADAIENALSNVMSVDKTRYHNIADTGQVVVNIVGSLCGGTGAGIFLDIAYLCRHLIGDGAISLIGTFGMPSMFSGITLGKLPNQYKRIRANCYSALTELEHFTTQARWRVTYPTLGDLDIDSPPYDVLYLVSGTNEENREFATQADAYRMISERILTETTSSLGIEFEEFFVNLDVLDGFIEIGGDKKPTAFSSYAVASLVIPRNSIRDHCSYRLAKEIIDLGLLKGCDDAEVDVTISTFTGTSTIDWASLIKYMREENQSISSQFIALTCSQEDLTEGVDTEDIPARARQQLDLLASEGSEDKLNFGRSIKSAVEGLLTLRLQQLQDQVDTIIRNNGVRFAQTFLKLINEDLVDFKKTLSDQKYSEEIKETEKECKADIKNMTETAEKTFTRSKSKRDDISQEVGEFVEWYYRLLNANLGSYAKNHLTESFYNPLIEFINNAMPVFGKCVKSLEGIGTLLRSADKRNLAIVSAESEGYSLDRSVMDTSDIENIYSENIGHISTHVTGFIQEFGLPIEWDEDAEQYTSWHTEKKEDVANSRFLSYCSQFANSTCAKYDIFSVLGSNPDQIGGKIEWLLDVSKPFCQYVGGTRGNADFEQVHIIAVPEAAYNSDQFKETIDTIRQKSEDKNKYKIVLTPNDDRISVVNYRHGHVLFSLADVQKQQAFYKRYDLKQLHVSKDWLDLEPLIPRTETPDYSEEAIIAWALGRTLDLENIKDRNDKPAKPIHWIGANVYWFKYADANVQEGEQIGRDFVTAYKKFVYTEEAVANVMAYVKYLEEKWGAAKMLEVVQERTAEVTEDWRKRQQSERKDILEKEINMLNQYANRLGDAL